MLPNSRDILQGGPNIYITENNNFQQVSGGLTFHGGGRGLLQVPIEAYINCGLPRSGMSGSVHGQSLNDTLIGINIGRVYFVHSGLQEVTIS